MDVPEASVLVSAVTKVITSWGMLAGVRRTSKSFYLVAGANAKYSQKTENQLNLPRKMWELY